VSIQYSSVHRSNNMTDIVTDLGTTSYLLIYTGAIPANCAASATGTLLVSLPCSSTFGTVSTGVLTANAITSTAAAATGTAGYWRLCTSSAGTTCVSQGLCYPSSTLNTSASTSAGNNILTFASGGGAISVGQTASGTNIPAGTYVLASSATSITLNQNVATGGVSSGATITFGGDLTFTGGVSFTTGETISVSSFTITATGA
jgi:hypothetical protein